ncbi:MAG: hypothetical protein NTY38_00440, partial [Acidobacteria bacterium]|nr:hypothetical protein [Acidobacteriota bacterium]
MEKVLASSDFARSDSLKHFLRHSVELTLDGQTDRLKESLVGVEIFGRSPSFDPRVDPIVRVQAVKLRTRLERYYSKEGQTDPIIVDFPKGGYVPVFHRREPEEIQPAAAVIPARRTGWKLPLAVAGLLIAAGIAVWIWWPGRPAVDARPVFTQVASQPGSTSAFPAISRQGNLLAFASDRGERGDLNIFIQAIGIEEPVQLTYHPAKERQPDFSPDGARIVFQS